MNTAHRFKLGDRVTFTGTIEKVRDIGKTLYEPAPLPVCYDRYPGTPYAEGIVIGRRTVQPGTIEPATEFDGYGNFIPINSNEFYPTPGAAFRVWLVAFDIRRKPVMVSDDQIKETA